jgi:hypothetical protein
MAEIGRRPVHVFISYSHKDEDLRNALMEHLAVLQREQWITVWHDRRITPGDEWKQEIDSNLLSAQMVLLLVSPSFMASDYCYGIELKVALDRHDKEGTLVIPVILRPVDWTLAPFGRLQALPRNARPVTEWPDRDTAFRDITSAIREKIDPDRAVTETPAEPGGTPTSRQDEARRGLPGPSRRTVLLVAVLLTFLSRVFFIYATPDAPLDTASTVIVFGFWLAACFGGQYLFRIRQQRQGSPKYTKGAQ